MSCVVCSAKLMLPKYRHYLQSPYYFMCCSLYDATEDRPAPVQPSTALAGTLVSSLHRLKDIDNAGWYLPGGQWGCRVKSLIVPGALDRWRLLCVWRLVNKAGGRFSTQIYPL